VRLEYPGYQSFNGFIQRNEVFDVGACVGGVFLLVPFLWIMAYKPQHTFELQPIAGPPPQPYPYPPQPQPYPQPEPYPPYPPQPQGR
jgi:hypothetical protein